MVSVEREREIKKITSIIATVAVKKKTCHKTSAKMNSVELKTSTHTKNRPENCFTILIFIFFLFLTHSLCFTIALMISRVIVIVVVVWRIVHLLKLCNLHTLQCMFARTSVLFFCSSVFIIVIAIIVDVKFFFVFINSFLVVCSFCYYIHCDVNIFELFLHCNGHNNFGNLAKFGMWHACLQFYVIFIS